MKKALAIILAAVMLLSLVACGDGAKTSPSPQASASPSAAPSEAPASDAGSSSAPAASPSAQGGSVGGTAGEATVGWYTDPVDHYAREQYDIVYMMMMSSVINASFSNGFKVWATRLNYNYSDYSANSDADAYLNTVETYAVQGMDGFIVDFSDDINDRMLEILAELKLNWMPGMTSAYLADGKLAHPTVSFDNYNFGVDMANYLIDNAKKKWGEDLDFSKVGFIEVDYSVVFEITERERGTSETYQKYFPDLYATNYWVADCVTQGSISAESAFNEVSPIISSHPEIEYWLVAGATDDFGQGGARALEDTGKDEKAMVICIGGETLIAEWDGGYDGCWVSAIYTAQMIYCEGIICGLIALIDGRATPETLWPTHIAADQTYAQITLQSVALERETYQEYLEWVDDYTGYDWSKYEYGGTDYSYTLEFRE